VSSVRIVCHLRPSGLLLPSLIFAGVVMVTAGRLRAQVGASSLGSSSATGTSLAATVVPSTVSGLVINAATGSPVPRALVRLNNRAVLTDHEGKFRFDQNTETNANILVSKPGFSASTESQEPGNLFLQAAQLGAPLELRLYPEALLTGTVLAPDGTPLPRISVTAQRSFYDDTGHRWMTAGQVQTDSHGNFRLPVSAGDYRLETRYSPLDRTSGEAVLPVMVPSEGTSSTSQTIRVHSGEEQHFDLRPAVSPAHFVTVTTQSSGGRDFTRITARSSNGSTLQVNPQMNGGTGETKIQLPQGTYTLTATRNNQENPEQAETTVTVPDHDISGVVFQFSPVPSIPVELIMDSSLTSDNTQPPTLPQLGLTLQSDQPDPERGDSTLRPVARKDQSFVFTASPGSYRLQGRNNGTWFIKSASYGDSDLLQQSLVVVPGAAGTPIRVTVSDQTGALQGTVSLNGSPSQCWIYLVPSGPSAQSVMSLRSNSSNGSYTSAHLPPGSYQVIAFERRHSVNYRDPESLNPFHSFVHSVTIAAGDKPTLNLDAVPVAEVAP